MANPVGLCGPIFWAELQTGRKVINTGKRCAFYHFVHTQGTRCEISEFGEGDGEGRGLRDKQCDYHGRQAQVNQKADHVGHGGDGYGCGA